VLVPEQKAISLCTTQLFQYLCYSFLLVRAASDSDQANEPFDLIRSLAPESSSIWQEWKKVVAADADAELQKLERCRTQRDCKAAEEKYAAIVKGARDKDDRAKIEFVHRRINGEIRYEPGTVGTPRPLVFAG
jgi:hypothetical protein